MNILNKLLILVIFTNFHTTFIYASSIDSLLDRLISIENQKKIIKQQLMELESQSSSSVTHLGNRTSGPTHVFKKVITSSDGTSTTTV